MNWCYGYEILCKHVNDNGFFISSHTGGQEDAFCKQCLLYGAQLPTHIAYHDSFWQHTLLYKGRKNTEMQWNIPMTEIKRLKHIISHVGAVGGEWYKWASPSNSTMLWRWLRVLCCVLWCVLWRVLWYKRRQRRQRIWRGIKGCWLKGGRGRISRRTQGRCQIGRGGYRRWWL